MVLDFVRGPDFWGKGAAREGPIGSVVQGVTQTQHVPSAWQRVSSPTKDSHHPGKHRCLLDVGVRMDSIIKGHRGQHWAHSVLSTAALVTEVRTRCGSHVS